MEETTSESKKRPKARKIRMTNYYKDLLSEGDDELLPNFSETKDAINSAPPISQASERQKPAEQTKAKKPVFQTKKIKREGPVRPWDVGPDDFRPPRPDNFSNPKQIEQKPDALTGTMTSQHTGQNTAVPKLTSQNTGQHTDQHTDQHTGQDTRQHLQQIGRQSQKLSLISIDQVDIKIFQILLSNVQSRNLTCIISRNNLAQNIGISPETIGRHIDKLWSLQAIKAKKLVKGGPIRGNIYELDPSRFDELLKQYNNSRAASIPDWKTNQFARIESLHRQNIDHQPASSRNDHGSLTGMLTGTMTSQHTDYSSSSILNNNTTTNSGIDFSEIDLSDFPGLDSSSLLRVRGKFKTTESLQDFVDRVAFAIKEKEGGASPIKDPNAFLFSALKNGGVNVGPGFKTRAILQKELELKLKEEEVAAQREMNEKIRKLESEEIKMKFEGWLLKEAAKRVKEFESQRLRENPHQTKFDVPASVRIRQLLVIQTNTFLSENSLPIVYFKDLFDHAEKLTKT